MSSQEQGLQTAGRQEHGWERVRERRHHQGDVGKREKPLLGTQMGRVDGRDANGAGAGTVSLEQARSEEQGTST